MRVRSGKISRSRRKYRQKLAFYLYLWQITDEQSHDQVPAPRGRGYVINVASNRNGVGYGAWMHVDGWSEAVVEFIGTLESADGIKG